MEALYHETNKLLQHIQFTELSRYEQSQGLSASSVIYKHLEEEFGKIESAFERLNVLANKEPPVRRSHARSRLDQLRYDYQHVLAAARHIHARQEARREEEIAREELLTRRFVRNSEGSGDASITMGYDSLSEHDTLQSNNSNLDNILSTGHAVLNSLQEQKGSLKGVRKKMLDIVNVLGMSNTVMRMIEKRSTSDKIIMCVGMAATLIFIFLVWKYIL